MTNSRISGFYNMTLEERRAEAEREERIESVTLDPLWRTLLVAIPPEADQLCTAA